MAAIYYWSRPSVVFGHTTYGYQQEGVWQSLYRLTKPTVMRVGKWRAFWSRWSVVEVGTNRSIGKRWWLRNAQRLAERDLEQQILARTIEEQERVQRVYRSHRGQV